jgi:hypothetical protein
MSRGSTMTTERDTGDQRSRLAKDQPSAHGDIHGDACSLCPGGACMGASVADTSDDGGQADGDEDVEFVAT